MVEFNTSSLVRGSDLESEEYNDIDDDEIVIVKLSRKICYLDHQRSLR